MKGLKGWGGIIVQGSGGGRRYFAHENKHTKSAHRCVLGVSGLILRAKKAVYLEAVRVGEVLGALQEHEEGEDEDVLHQHDHDAARHAGAAAFVARDVVAATHSREKGTVFDSGKKDKKPACRNRECKGRRALKEAGRFFFGHAATSQARIWPFQVNGHRSEHELS